MINDAFIFSCDYPPTILLFEWETNPSWSHFISADDDSDTSPHDLEGGNADLEYGSVLLNVNNHQSFTQMQVRVLAIAEIWSARELLLFRGSRLDQESILFTVVNQLYLQGDLDRQRLLGDRPRAGIYESVVEDGLEGIEHQER